MVQPEWLVKLPVLRSYRRALSGARIRFPSGLLVQPDLYSWQAPNGACTREVYETAGSGVNQILYFRASGGPSAYPASKPRRNMKT